MTRNLKAESHHDFASLAEKHSIGIGSTLREALGALNNLSGESMTLFVVKEDGELVGSVTDGDIRRGIVRGASLDDTVANVMRKDFVFATPGADFYLALAEGRKRHIDLLPVVEDGRLSGLVDLKKIKTILPVDAVLMAGGRGERLRPLTENLPKPLLPVGGKPIIDYNIEELESCGIDNIFVTVNYLAEMIEDHFRNYRGRSRIECIREPSRLGTMGSISLIKDFQNDDVILMNADLLTNIDFEALYLRHKENGAHLTMASVPYSVSVPFAVMHLREGRVTGLEEKPTFNYFANAGVYIMRSDIISRVKPGEYLDAPDFICDLIKDGGNVGLYPIEGTWIDIGSPDDYRHANELMSRRLRSF